MKISELIALLEQRKEELGDVYVSIYDHIHTEYNRVDEVAEFTQTDHAGREFIFLID